MRDGEGAIRLNLSAALGRLPSGSHRLHYRNSHRSDIGVYLANALVPTNDAVRITSQQRDSEQHDLVIAYTLEATMTSRWSVWPIAGISLLVGFVIFWWRWPPS